MAPLSQLLLGILALATPYGPVTAAPTSPESSVMERTPVHIVTELVGDGSPHGNFFNRQVTETMECKTATCQAIHEQGHDITFGISSTITPAEWLDGGLDVSYTWTESNGYSCQGNPGDIVCVWYRKAYTGYTVRNFAEEGTTVGLDTDPFVLYSPNKNNEGGYFYCVSGSACRSIDQGYWDVDP